MQHIGNKGTRDEMDTALAINGNNLPSTNLTCCGKGLDNNFEKYVRLLQKRLLTPESIIHILPWLLPTEQASETTVAAELEEEGVDAQWARILSYSILLTIIFRPSLGDIRLLSMALAIGFIGNKESTMEKMPI